MIHQVSNVDLGCRKQGAEILIITIIYYWIDSIKSGTALCMRLKSSFSNMENCRKNGQHGERDVRGYPLFLRHDPRPPEFLEIDFLYSPTVFFY
jgi:hypothetical protein